MGKRLSEDGRFSHAKGRIVDNLEIKIGDIFQLDEHRVMCGDATNAEDVAALMGGGKAALIHADPPYGLKKQRFGIHGDNANRDDLLDFNRKWIGVTLDVLEDNGSFYCWGNNEGLMDIYAFIMRPLRRAPYKNRMTFRNLVTWDKGSGQGQLSELHRMFATADEKCLFYMKGQQDYGETKADYWEGWEPIRRYFENEKKKSGLTNDQLAKIDSSRVTHYWAKSQWEMPNEANWNKLRTYCIEHGIDAFREEYEHIREEYEHIREEWRKTRAYFDNTSENMNSVWHFQRVLAGTKEWKEAKGFPTIKPVALCKRVVTVSAREGDVVLDPFGGSGSTLIACEDTNRRCRMMEITPRHVANIIKRWEEHTGKEAVRIR